MSEATIRAQIKAVMDAVTGAGKVHDYSRHSRSWATLRNLLIKTGSTTVKAWSIYREACQAEIKTFPYINRQHVFRIDGILELDDSAASEKTFQALIDTIFTAFAGNQTLANTCVLVEPLQVESIDTEEIENTLFHVASLKLVCHERVTYS